MTFVTHLPPSGVGGGKWKFFGQFCFAHFEKGRNSAAKEWQSWIIKGRLEIPIEMEISFLREAGKMNRTAEKQIKIMMIAKANPDAMQTPFQAHQVVL